MLNLSLPETLSKSLASSAPAQLPRAKSKSYFELARSKPQAVARALQQGYAWEDREAFAIVCAPFLILALWFTYQHTMRPAPLMAPEIAILRESAPPAPVAALEPQKVVAPSATKPIEIPSEQSAASSVAPVISGPAIEAPAASNTANREIARAAPFLTEAPVPLPQLASLMPQPEPLMTLAVPSAPAPAAVASANVEPVPAPPAALPLAAPPPPRVAVKRALPPLALVMPPPAEPLPSLASITPEPMALPASVAASLNEPGMILEIVPSPAAPTLPDTTIGTSASPGTQQLAALAPMVPPPTPEAAPGVATPPQRSSPALPPDACLAPQALFAPAATGQAATLTPTHDFGLALARAARDQLSSVVIYNAKYARIGFPNGDVAPLFGVCTDVVVRAYRTLGIDLQQLIADTRSGRGDRNIDHRRVEVVRRFLSLHGEMLPISEFAEDYRPGDLVTYYRPQNRSSTAHIAIVSDVLAPSGRYMIVHNRGWGPQLEDALFVDKITGHYRFAGLGRKEHDAAPAAAALIASATPWAKAGNVQHTRVDGGTPLPLQPASLTDRGNTQAALCHPGRGQVARATAPPVAAAVPASAPSAPASAAKAQAAKASPKALQKAANGVRGKAGPGRTVIAAGNS